MRGAPSEEDWDRIHRLQFVDQPGCWTTCGGGYCCKFNSPHLKFGFMKPNSAGMVFFEGEYRFLERRGILQEGFHRQARSWTFPVGDGLELRFVTSVCSLDGRCSIPAYRPLLCKLYPFLPRIDPETLQVTGHVVASAIDQLWPALGTEEPCTLSRERADAVKRQMQPGVEALKEHAYILFYLKAAELFLDGVAAHVARLRRDAPDAPNDRVVARWEFDYLAGRAFDREDFRARLQAQYRALRRRFPGFELAP